MKTLSEYIGEIVARDGAVAVEDMDATLKRWQSTISRAIMQCDSRCMTSTVRDLREVSDEIGAARMRIFASKR